MDASNKQTIVEALEPLATPIDQLKLLPGNPRRGNIEAVAASLATFGQRKPIVASKDGTVIAGNHTLQAATKLGWTHIAVVFVDDDTTTAKAYALADNRTAELGSYDDQLLADLISEVQAADEELFNATGWTADNLTSLLDQLEPDITVIDQVNEPEPAPDTAPQLTVPGDIWQLGPHRVMCGDASVPTDVDKLLDHATIHVAFTSPPYAEQRAYDGKSGFKPIPPDQYVDWFAPIAANVAANLADDGSWFVNIKPASRGLDTELYVFDLVLAHAREWGWHFATEFCWERIGFPQQPHRRFKNQYEPVFQFTKNDWKFRPEAVVQSSDGAFKYEKGKDRNLKRDQGAGTDWFKGRAEEGVAYPGNRLPTFAASYNVTGHAAAFPVGLPEWFIKAYSDPGDNIYDPFCGSGSTIIAAHQQNRIGYGMELSATYVDIICRRWQRTTGIMPTNVKTGQQHDFDPT